ATIIIRSRGNVADFYPDRRDARVVKHDSEEGQASIARRGGDETAEQQLAVGVEELDQCAGVPVTALAARSAAIRLVNVCEHCAEAPDRCRDSAIRTRYKEQRFSNVAPYRSEQPRFAERCEDLAVGGITKEHCQPPLGPARWRSLRKA